MKKLEKKEIKAIKGGVGGPCYTFCADQFNACLAAGTNRDVCKAERAECWLYC